MHVIDAKPARSTVWTQAALDRRRRPSCSSSVTGLEEVTSQTVHARHSYRAEDIRFGHRYADIFVDVFGTRLLDFASFHDTVPTGTG